MVITEIAYGGLDGTGPDGEYVELTNIGDAPQDLSGWTFATGVTTTPTGSQSLATLGDATGTSTVVAPGESVVVTDLPTAEFRTEWGLRRTVKVVNDGAATLKKAGYVALSNGSTQVDKVTYDLTGPGKGRSAYLTLANVADQQTASGATFAFGTGVTSGTSNGWTVSTAGDAEGSWASAHTAVGSPAASTLGTSTPAGVKKAGDIQITELAYGGLASGTHAYAGDTGDGEYLELTNVGEAAQDLTGWTYQTTKAGIAQTATSLTSLGTVAPGESVILTDLTPADFRTEWNLKPAVKVLNDGTSTMDKGPDVITISNGTSTVDSLTYAASYLAAKGLSAYVNAGHLADTDTATAGAWTKPSTVGDAEGSWTSAAGAVGSPGASTQGTSTPGSVTNPPATTITVAGAANQSATANTAFSFTGLSASGGTGSYSWTAPALAGTGLSINASTGAITGTPTTAGTIDVTVTASDGVNTAGTASFTITVAAGIDPHWQNIVINEITSDNEDNAELTGHLPPALYAALSTTPNLARDLVEIANNGDQAVDITGWRQSDSHGIASATDFSGRVFDVTGARITSIPAHGYGVFQSGQGLSSGGDAVSIYLPDGTQVDSVSYDGSQAGYDAAFDPTAAGPNPTTETYHTLARCPDGSGAVGVGSDANGTPWYSVKTASFGSSNGPSCDTSSDPDAAVQKYNQQPPTGLPSTCMPSAPAGSNSVAVPGIVDWPTSDVAAPIDNACQFITAQDPTGNDISGLVYSADGSVLWAAQNKNHLWKLVKDPATGRYVPATDNDWGNGKGITFTGTDPSASEVDSEGLTIGGDGHLFATSERDNTNSAVSKDEVLEYDQDATGTTLAPLRQWDLTSEFVPSVIAATGEDANLGFEGVTYVPDSFLTSQGFRDQHLGKRYDPADYPLHGSGLFFLAFEKTGHVFAYALNSDGSFQRVADVDTGVDGVSAIADVQFNADDQGIWAHCDNDCGVAESLLKIDASGDFTRVASYRRPAGLPNDNFEGFAIAPASTAVDGKREVVWSDDGIYGSGNAWNADKTSNIASVGWGHALFAGTIPVSSAPTGLSGTITTQGTFGSAYSSAALTPTGGFPAVFSYRLSAGSLPDGLVLDPATGAISGTPTVTGSYPVTVAVDNGVGSPATLSATITITPAALTTDTPTISGTAQVGRSLTASAGSWGPDGVATAFQWRADGVALNGETGTSLALTPALLGKAITVSVTGSLPGYATATKTSAATAAVAPGALAGTTPIISGTPRVGAKLMVTAGAWGPGTVQLAYQWFAGGVVIPGASSTTLQLKSTQVGKPITVAVTGREIGYADLALTSAATAPVAVGNISPGKPKIVGVAKVGRTLTVATGTWLAGDGVPRLRYQWLANGAPIAGRTGRTLPLGSRLRGKRISVRVTASAAGYAVKAVTSAATTRVA
ncbi:hypothetical protein GCM10028772_27070 [Nocardioides ultimimeridianus]